MWGTGPWDPWEYMGLLYNRHLRVRLNFSLFLSLIITYRPFTSRASWLVFPSLHLNRAQLHDFLSPSRVITATVPAEVTVEVTVGVTAAVEVEAMAVQAVHTVAGTAALGAVTKCQVWVVGCARLTGLPRSRRFSKRTSTQKTNGSPPAASARLRSSVNSRKSE